ncbi:hypothetical protein IQ07DRAFT_7433 [Pyrenochaeta sp. DS3sAY3a]|nr:hypothetical protein IQ07DRAFT_7433 [Pyrenochaeta sp. DS3sAY3a]
MCIVVIVLVLGRLFLSCLSICLCLAASAFFLPSYLVLSCHLGPVAPYKGACGLEPEKSTPMQISSYAATQIRRRSRCMPPPAGARQGKARHTCLGRGRAGVYGLGIRSRRAWAVGQWRRRGTGWIGRAREGGRKFELETDLTRRHWKRHWQWALARGSSA